MSNFAEPRAVESSLKIYRRLLAAYPSEYRQEYSGPMEQLFRDQCRDAWNDSRKWGLMKLWLRVIPDLLKTSLLEHLTQFYRRKNMFKLFNARSTSVSVFVTAFSAVFLLVLGAVVLVTFMMPESYFATTRIRVERGAAGIVTNAQGHVESTYDPYFIQTEFEVIKSEAILGPVIDKLKLRELWGQKYGGGQNLKRTDALALLKNSIVVRPVRNTSIIEIRAYADTPGEAAQIADAVAESFRDYRRNQFRQIAATNFSAFIGQVQIIDPAFPNRRPVAPKWALNIVLGVFLGIFLGSVAGAASTGFLIIRRRRHGNPDSLTPSHATT